MMLRLMNQGRIVELGTAESVYKHPNMQYTKDLLAAIPKGIPKDMQL